MLNGSLDGSDAFVAMPGFIGALLMGVCFAGLSCGSPCYWLGLKAGGVLSREGHAGTKPGTVTASLASLLGQSVFWQMDKVLQTIINQRHPD